MKNVPATWLGTHQTTILIEKQYEGQLHFLSTSERAISSPIKNTLVPQVKSLVLIVHSLSSPTYEND